jgi:hypothetical protein
MSFLNELGNTQLSTTVVHSRGTKVNLLQGREHGVGAKEGMMGGVFQPIAIHSPSLVAVVIMQAAGVVLTVMVAKQVVMGSVNERYKKMHKH